jgi:hypothetical protein
VFNFYDWKGKPKDDDIDAMRIVVALDLTPAQRALLAPIGLGFQMFYGDKDYDVQIPCLPSSLVGAIKIEPLKRFNWTMLLHAFQLGMADAENRDPGVIQELKENMGVVIHGVLTGGDGSIREVDLFHLLGGGTGFLGLVRHSFALAMQPFRLFCDFTVSVDVGTLTQDDDMYAAAIARTFRLDESLVVEVRGKIATIQSRISSLESKISKATKRLNDIPVLPNYPKICVLALAGLGFLVDPTGTLETFILTICSTIWSAELALAATNQALDIAKKLEGAQADLGVELRQGILTAFVGATRIYSKSLPVGERQCLFPVGEKTCKGLEGEEEKICKACDRSDQVKIENYASYGIVTDHNPARHIGNGFLWEGHPKNGDITGATQGGGANGNSGLFDDQIIAKYKQRVDVMREGAGLGFLLPYILSNRDEVQQGLPAIELYDNRSVPYLNACFTNSRIIGQVHFFDDIDPLSGDAPCTFSFFELTPDRFDIDIEARNDTRMKARLLKWGSHPNLNIDRETHPAYVRIAYAKYGMGRTGRNIFPEADYDYYTVIKDGRYDAVVTVSWPGYPVDLIVDGEKAERKCDNSPPLPCIRGGTSSITVPGRAMHTIRVSSVGARFYDLTLSRIIPGDLDGDGDVDRNDLNVLLADRDKSVSASSCGASCDLDDDGTITALDARKLVLLCTRPRCATE